MSYTVDVKETPAQPFAAIRASTTPAELSSTLGQILPEVWAHLERLGVQPAGPPVTRYLEHSAERVQIEAGFPVPTPVAADGRIIAGELGGGRVAVVMHVGPYDKLPEAYQALEAWLREQGHVAAGPPWEIYWTDPSAVPDPADWKTEVLWPIR